MIICTKIDCLFGRIQIKITLASTSPYRKALLERLKLDFTTADPQLQEEQRVDESASAMAARLAAAKADSIAQGLNGGLVIGSDQTVECDGEILGKPGNFEKAKQQLQMMRGKALLFHTGLCVINVDSGRRYQEVVDYSASFRPLTDDEIERYLQLDKPFNCAGSFKSEALGIALLENMHGNDPTALIGLPLIRLSQILREQGIKVP